MEVRRPIDVPLAVGFEASPAAISTNTQNSAADPGAVSRAVSQAGNLIRETSGILSELESSSDAAQQRSDLPTSGARVALRWKLPAGKSTVLQLTLLAIGPILVGAIGACAISALNQEVYAARSEVVFNVGEASRDPATRFLETQVLIVESPSTLAPIAKTFGVPLKELEKDLDVEIVNSSAVMRLQYANPDKSTALKVTGAITDQYLVALRQFEQADGSTHRLLTPATIMEDPVSPKPARAALMGAVAGLAIAAAGVMLRTQIWAIR